MPCIGAETEKHPDRPVMGVSSPSHQLKLVAAKRLSPMETPLGSRQRALHRKRVSF
ncbi:hypothetical protein [Desmospora profundinema]|uniref:Uncharacterized protein n=1 Tax=Desmospora profundinema TaxID=1571184 RepID=A0ABU1IRL9_9BACL|nr:hypothetical protein [Desmospora profundinema]MDR6227331.1 hypothetical protein [Desmospora profundinema]